MAYIVSIEHKCSSCSDRRATHEVRNQVNAVIGQFCLRCATAAVARLQVLEDKEGAA